MEPKRFLQSKERAGTALLPSPPSSPHPPSMKPLNPGHDHRQLLQSFNQPSANISVKTAARERRTDARLQSGSAAPLNSVRDDWTEAAKIRSNDGKKVRPHGLLWPKRCFGIRAGLQSSRFALSINTQAFTTGLLSRPQRGAMAARTRFCFSTM